MSLLTLNSHGAIPHNSKMYNFYIEQKFVDTKLVLEDGDIRSHSVVLATGSKKLYSMLAVQNETQKTLTLTQFSKETMRVVLEYIYRGLASYYIQNEEAVMMAIHFLELEIKTDGCKVDSSLGETDNSVVEVKKEEFLIEISDDETVIDPGTIQNENNQQKRKSEHFSPTPSNVFNKSYDFLSQCNRNLYCQVLTSPSESSAQVQPEKNSSNVNSNPKRKKTESVVKNPFSQYVNKKSEGISQQQNSQSKEKSTPRNQEIQTGISQQDDPCTSKSTLRNQETETGISRQQNNPSTSKSTLQNPETETGISRQQNNPSTSKSTLRNQETETGISRQQNNPSTSKSTLRNQETETGISRQQNNPSTSKSTLRNQETETGISRQQNNPSTSKSTLRNQTTKRRNTDFWFNKKDNPPKLSKKYCLVCEEKQNYFKAHTGIFHKAVIRSPPFLCEKCSKRFYFKVFYEKHVRTCSK